MKTGIVMEIQDNKAVIMLSDYTIVTTKAKSDWMEGMTVEIKQRKATSKYIIAAAACFVIALTVAGIGQWTQSQTVTLISVDTHSGIEIGLNRSNEVVLTKGYTDEGNKLLASIDVKGKSAEEAMEALVDTKSFQSSVKKSKAVIFAVEAEDNSEQEQLISYLNQIDYLPSSSSELKVISYPVDKKIVNEAHSYDITPGKYMVLLDLKKENPDMDIEAYLDKDVGDLYHMIRYKKKWYPSSNAPETSPTEPSSESQPEESQESPADASSEYQESAVPQEQETTLTEQSVL